MANKGQKERENAAARDLLGLLADSLQDQWRRYRKRLKQCQKRFSEKAVHDSRVETRRLLSTLELLQAFIPEEEIEKALDALKRHLDNFDELRDTQVQLVYVDQLARRFPAARSFRNWLRKREARFAWEASRDIKRVKTKRTGKRIASLEKEIRRQRKTTARSRALAAALKEIDSAFSRVAARAERCRRMNSADTTPIHRTRVALKHFRYMVEALSPLLPAVSEEDLRALHGYQSMMGDIQDAEVLLLALDKFLARREIKAGQARRLREELIRRRKWLIKVCLNALGRLPQFWPPPEIRAILAANSIS